jgi:hypothetical protein
MTKTELHRKALILRRQHKSYSQIKQILKISKSTLSVWLRKYPLSDKDIKALRDNSQIRIEKYRATMQKKRILRNAKYYKEEKIKWLPLTEKEMFIAGLFLYWGEGNKSQRSTISINNTDPSVMKFALFWLVKGLNIAKEKIQVFLHLYDDMNINEEINYWSQELNIDKQQFSRPYIKKSKKSSLDHKGFGHGTCGIRVNDTILKERILMATKAIADYYNAKISSI